jgi:hypothetical protein
LGFLDLDPVNLPNAPKGNGTAPCAMYLPNLVLSAESLEGNCTDLLLDSSLISCRAGSVPILSSPSFYCRWLLLQMGDLLCRKEAYGEAGTASVRVPLTCQGQSAVSCPEAALLRSDVEYAFDLAGDIGASKVRETRLRSELIACWMRLLSVNGSSNAGISICSVCSPPRRCTV